MDKGVPENSDSHLVLMLLTQCSLCNLDDRINLGKKKDQVFPSSVLYLNQFNSQSFPNPLNLLNLLVCRFPSPYLIIDCYFVRSRYSTDFG